MTVFLSKLEHDRIAPVYGSKSVDVLIAGNPVTKTWVSYESSDGRMSSGIWECDIGCWRVHYTEWEYCFIERGRCVVVGDNGERIVADAGHSFMIEPGFAGTWEIVQPVRKQWIIRHA